MTKSLAQVAQERIDLAFKRVGATDDGQMVLAHIIFALGQFDQSALVALPSGAIDPLLLAAREGRRHCARELRDLLLELDPSIVHGIYAHRFNAERDAALAAKEQDE